MNPFSGESLSPNAMNIIDSPWIAIDIESDRIRVAYLDASGLAQVVRPPKNHFDMVFHYTPETGQWDLGDDALQYIDTDPAHLETIHIDALIGDPPVREENEASGIRQCQLIARMLQRVKRYCEDNLFDGRPVQSCVLSIHHRHDALRQNCRRIAREAGFEKIVFRDAMISAATTWQSDWPGQDSPYVLICNLAASRITMSVLQSRHHGFEKIPDCFSKNTPFGINEIDVKILDRLDAGLSVSSPNFAAERLRLKMIREEWNRDPNKHLSLDVTVTVNGTRRKIKSTDFDRMAQWLGESLLKRCRKCLADRKIPLDPEDVPVLLVGEGALFSKLTQPFEDFFGANCFTWPSSAEAIVLGSAWMLSPKLPPFKATDEEIRFFEAWLKATEENDVGSQYFVGYSLEKGLGVARNADEAVDWYRSAAEQGHSDAARRLDRLIDPKGQNSDKVPSRKLSPGKSRKKGGPPKPPPIMERNDVTAFPCYSDSPGHYEPLYPVGTPDRPHSPYGELWMAADFEKDLNVSVLQLNHRLFERDSETVWKSVEKAFLLKHPQYYSAIDCDLEKKWVVTEPVGEKLSDLISVAPLSSAEVRNILHDMLDLLSYFEACEFIHGDIRPDMLFLPYEADRPRSVRLGFSPSPRLDDEILLGTRSMKYSTPEWINPDFGETSPATDLYALAFCALELLVGPDFDSKYELLGSTDEERWVILHSVPSERLPRIKQLIPGVDKDLSRFLHTILQRTVAYRPQNAKAARKMLNDRTEGHLVPEREELLQRRPEPDIKSGESDSSEIEEADSPEPDHERGTVKLVSSYASELEEMEVDEDSMVDKAVMGSLEKSRRFAVRTFHFLGSQLKRPIVLFPLLIVILTTIFLISIFTQPEKPKKEESGAPAVAAPLSPTETGEPETEEPPSMPAEQEPSDSEEDRTATESAD